MRKLLILSTPLFIALIALCISGLSVQAQNSKNFENEITKANSDFIKWFKTGQIDSIGNLYHKEASLIFDNMFPVIDNFLPAVNGRESILLTPIKNSTIKQDNMIPAFLVI